MLCCLKFAVGYLCNYVPYYSLRKKMRKGIGCLVIVCFLPHLIRTFKFTFLQNIREEIFHGTCQVLLELGEIFIYCLHRDIKILFIC